MPRLSPSTLASVLIGASGLAGGVSAQTPEPNRGPVVELDEIVVTGTPYGVSGRATVLATTVIDEEALLTAPASTLGDLVNGLPGVRSTAFAPGASRPVIRGLGGPRVLVLTNGLGMIDASTVSPDHQVAADPAEARRIEIVRGPSTLVYGGSAIGGVVNILDDRIPDERPEGGLDGHLGAQYSTVDDGRSLGGRLKADAGPLVLTLDGFTRQASDYDVPVFPESRRQLEAEGEEAGDERSVAGTFVELEQIGAGLSWIGSRGFIGVSVKQLDTRYGVPGHEHEEAGEEEHDDEHEEDHNEEDHGDEGVSIGLEQTRYDLRGELAFDAGPFARARLGAGYADYQHTEFEGEDVGTRFFSHGAEGRLELIQREQDGWRGAVGLQALDRTFDAVGDEAYVPRTEIAEQGLYTVQRLDRGRIGFEGGVRLDRRTLDSARAQRDFDNVSASGGVFGRPTPQLFIGLTAARNARAPSEVELFAQGAHVATGVFEVGDIDLESEVATSLEATAHYAAGPLEADLHVYRARYRGFIDLRPAGGEDAETGFPVFAYVQTDADFAGLEADLHYHFWERGERALVLRVAGDWVRATTDLGPAARIPPWSATIGLDWTGGAHDLGFEVRRVGAQDRLAAFELPTDGYTLVSLSGSWRPFDEDGLTLFAEATNLFDQEAREHVSFLKDIAPLPGRNLRVGVAYRF